MNSNTGRDSAAVTAAALSRQASALRQLLEAPRAQDQSWWSSVTILAQCIEQDAELLSRQTHPGLSDIVLEPLERSRETAFIGHGA